MSFSVTGLILYREEIVGAESSDRRPLESSKWEVMVVWTRMGVLVRNP